MKVKELIEELQQFDPELPVMISGYLKNIPAISLEEVYPGLCETEVKKIIKNISDEKIKEDDKIKQIYEQQTFSLGGKIIRVLFLSGSINHNHE